MSEAPDNKAIAAIAMRHCTTAFNIVSQVQLFAHNFREVMDCRDWLAGIQQNIKAELDKPNEVAPTPA